MADVRTRFAPSPTGFLHVGSARTALLNRAFSRRHGGTFVLRIEDTDRERSTRESEAAVLDGLEWLQLDWDEGPFRQSERAERYATALDGLLSEGHAYRCRCTPDEIEERRSRAIAEGRKWIYDGRCRDLDLGPDCGPHVIRLRLPTTGWIGFEDLVFGPSGQDAAEIGDMIIRRSDGQPLFHFAGAVDDIDMNISHVIRGADHHVSTPFQVAIYAALGAQPPLFAHVPLIVGASGKKLSKRHDPVSVQSYRDEGYLPEALRNWLVRIGWSHGDQEIFSDEEICSLFDLAHVHRANAQADPEKLQWLNQHYIKERSRDALWASVRPFLEKTAGRTLSPEPELLSLVDLLRERSKTLGDLAEQARFALVDEIEWDERSARKLLKASVAQPLMELRQRLAQVEPWAEPGLEDAFQQVVAAHELKLGKLAQPVRLAVTGRTNSPGIFETLAVCGRDRVLTRLDRALREIPTA